MHDGQATIILRTGFDHHSEYKVADVEASKVFSIVNWLRLHLEIYQGPSAVSKAV